jgi:hypothetical protein
MNQHGSTQITHRTVITTSGDICVITDHVLTQSPVSYALSSYRALLSGPSINHRLIPSTCIDLKSFVVSSDSLLQSYYHTPSLPSQLLLHIPSLLLRWRSRLGKEIRSIPKQTASVSRPHPHLAHSQLTQTQPPSQHPQLQSASFPIQD